MTTTPKPRPSADLDVPLHRLEADVKALVALKRTAAGSEAEQRHQLEPPVVEDVFAHLAIDHPDACSTARDYSDWTPGRAS